MTDVSIRTGGDRLTALVGSVTVGGGLAVAATALVVPHLPLPADSPALASTAVVLLFVIASAVGELVAVPLVHGEASEDLTFFEVVIAAALLLLAPMWVVLAPLAGLAITQVWVRRPLQKSAFNLGSYAAGGSVAVLTYLLVAQGAERFSVQGVVALVLALAAFSLVNSTLVGVVLSRVQGVPFRSTISELWQLPALMTFAGAGIGAMAVELSITTPALLPFTLLPVLALWFAYRTTSHRAEERERNAWLVVLSGVLSAEHPLPRLLDEASEAIRSAFGAPQVLVELPALDDLTTTWPASDGVLPIPAGRLPQDWVSGVMTALELGDGRRGALMLGERRATRAPWLPRPSDEALLTTVAASLSSAVRGAERRAALVEESSKLKAVVENASDGIAVLSGTGQVRLWSPALARITGVPERVAQLGGDDAPQALTALVSVATHDGVVTGSGPADVVARSVMLVRPDGETRDVTVAVVAARSGDGGEPVAILTVHDVTSQARADRLKSDFVATISHELRTPITPIKGYAQLLLARGDAMTPERRRAAYELIAERADHLGRLVEDLLMASRASGTLGSKLTTTPDQHDLRAIVSAASDSFPALADRLVVEQPDGPVPVWCDSIRTVQIVSNLLSNAAKYSPEGSPVLLVVHPSEFGDTHVRIDVVDHGCGLAEADRERVFERFYRVEDSMTMRTSGSGLGLYIARELAVAMGGSLTVASQPGLGSTFTVRLPRDEASAGSPPTLARTA